MSVILEERLDCTEGRKVEAASEVILDTATETILLS